MARPSGPKTRCSGTWTEARFHSFIKSALRQATRRWKPKSDAMKAARVKRGFYLCAGCKEIVPASERIDGKKKKTVVDHIKPIVDPEVGFTTWDDCINRMFCEVDNLQVLCHRCHDRKSNDERATAKERRARSK